ncbi:MULTISPECIES: trypsin-like peptidase domain-containing protein [Acidobacterium]|uniref:Protease, Do family n=1 Tax=Acidobacterium capsulatum (strain ATCC 51196 / DSM 11244 / BCRC 80197 / JCM 7670 / NBRC 15755 / NCIMB 13165 / 161) TaxID=240015 RepID=C1F9B8_ACIC5|nr:MULTISPECIES: trypsin-like peptidase domain-containing protein [Acidobacterium]ACO33470.1 protease, Do family [Acidobacterium capsulatum ATCC 51196]HCT61640.1 PDZ domain-containing protein [Acidobacterium sp.]
MKSMLRRLGNRRLASTFTILATLSAGILIGSIAAHGVHGQEKVNSSDAAQLTIPKPVNLATNFTKIAKEVSPAVVNISTETVPKHVNNQQQMGPGGDNGMQQFFQHFFGMGPMGPQEGQPDDSGQVREALGSGFIVDPHGYIITNYHVIKGATSILVKLKSDPAGSNGHTATVVGFDKSTDLAVIKIKVDHPLPVVQMGNSDSMQVGDQVIAIGAPLALTQTVTAGIVSAKDRDIEPGAAGEFKHYIQTDAAINPGNSGGPLVNMDGQVIGVNTAIYTETGGFQGIGFAMPSNTVINVYNQLIGPEHKVVRGSLGVEFQQNLPPAVAHVYGVKSGVLISSVVAGSPAAKAGLKPGDIITSVDGTPIRDGNDLINNISVRKPGSSVNLGFVHDGKPQTANVTIFSQSELQKLIANGGNGSGSGSNGSGETGHVKLGITVSNLPPGAPAGLQGVLIQGVEPGSFADTQLHLNGAEGMVITAINRHQVHNVAEFKAIVGGLHSGDDVALQLVNPQDPNAGTNYVGGTLP